MRYKYHQRECIPLYSLWYHAKPHGNTDTNCIYNLAQWCEHSSMKGIAVQNSYDGAASPRGNAATSPERLHGLLSRATLIPQAIPSWYDTLASINGQDPVCRSSLGAGALGGACSSLSRQHGDPAMCCGARLQASLKCCSASTMPPAHLLEACRRLASPGRHWQTDRTLPVPARSSRSARQLNHITALQDQGCNNQFS